MAVSGKVFTWNVNCAFIASFFYFLGGNFYESTVMPSFILYLGGSNLAIGAVEGLQGISNTLSALPSGYFADKYSRRMVIRIGAVIWIITSVLTITSVTIAEAGSMNSYMLLCVALAFHGVSDGILQGPMAALMDDSVPVGSRSDVEMVDGIVTLVAAGLGPVITAVLFAQSGGGWDIHTMQLVIVSGVLIAQGCLIPMILMDDRKALGRDSEAVHLQTGLLDAEGSGGEAKAVKDKDAETGKALEVLPSNRTFFGLVGPDSVVYLMFASDVIVGIGGGMTMKFFPVFFQHDCGISPATLNITFAVLCVTSACAMGAAQDISKEIGRVQTILPLQVFGIIGTFLLGALTPYYSNAYIMLPLFVTRCSALLSTSALEASVVADYTPKSQRARWKALNSVSSMSWSGSAIIGGWLIDKYGFSACFIITAIFELACIPFLLLIMPHVAKESDLAAALENRERSGDAAEGTVR